MIEVPEFRLYGEDDTGFQENIQPSLEFRGWCDLSERERGTALQELTNNGWMTTNNEVLATVAKLNNDFLRICPGRELHKIQPHSDAYGRTNESERKKAALKDFRNILLSSQNEKLILRSLSVFAKYHIDFTQYNWAKDAETEEEREGYIKKAFSNLDRLANCLNHVFEQFAVNARMTRNGLVPRQDEKIIQSIYVPTLNVLSNPKWSPVNVDLAGMFEDFDNRRYADVIAKAHRAMQTFLQILVGEQKNGKGELATLYRKAKSDGMIQHDRFSEPIVNALKSFIVSERATKSSAKPAKDDATSADALLVMNAVMLFLQHSLLAGATHDNAKN